MPLEPHIDQRIGEHGDAGRQFRLDASGRVVDTFRVSEDRTLATVEDDVYCLDAAATIGLPHPLELPAELVRKWGQVLADYRIIQPFDQLGRPIYALQPEEVAARAITRFMGGRKLHYGKILSLEKRGWRRGEAQDGGVISWMEKKLPNGATAYLNLEEGLYAGGMTESPEQSLGSCFVMANVDRGWPSEERAVPIKDVNAIVFSELVSDLQSVVN